MQFIIRPSDAEATTGPGQDPCGRRQEESGHRRSSQCSSRSWLLHVPCQFHKTRLVTSAVLPPRVFIIKGKMELADAVLERRLNPEQLGAFSLPIAAHQSQYWLGWLVP